MDLYMDTDPLKRSKSEFSMHIVFLMILSDVVLILPKYNFIINKTYFCLNDDGRGNTPLAVLMLKHRSHY